MKKGKLLCGLMSHMTKMATKSIKGKTFRNCRTQCADSQKTCSIGDSEPWFVEKFFFSWIREEGLSVNKIFDFLHDRRAWHKKL